jgi:hypothetical protein
MRPFITILLSVLPTLLFGQLNIDTTKIKSQQLTDTTNQAFYGASNGLTPLAKSDNYLEIRMSVFYAPVGGFEDRVITYDGKVWNGTLIKSALNFYDTTATTIIKLIPRHGYTDIIQQLVDIGLFTLPSQHELNKPNRVFDGNMYSITYKVGNRYRQLTFDNPSIYKKLYRKTKTFKRYEDLVDVFYNSFDKQ